MADYLDFLATDPDTTAIGLVVEGIRRPGRVLPAARRCIAAGKPIVALKLARNSRTQQMAASHTGALAGNAWAYDVSFRQAGIQLAYDLEELVDRLAIVSQLDPARWTGVQRIGVVAGTGGFASLAFDVAEAEGLDTAASGQPRRVGRRDHSRNHRAESPWTPPASARRSGPTSSTATSGHDELDAVVFVNMWSDDTACTAASSTMSRSPPAATASPSRSRPGQVRSGAFAKEVIGDDGAVALGYGIRGTPARSAHPGHLRPGP